MNYDPAQSSLFTENETDVSTPYPPPKPKINRIAESRSRLQHSGATALSQVELLSLLISGDAGNIWYEYQSLGAIAQAPWRELVSLTGVGEVAVCRIKAAAELGRRLLQEDRGQRPQISNPGHVADLLMLEMRDLEQEHLRVILIDTKNYVLDIPLIYIGNVNSSIIRPSEVFRPAIRMNAPAMILVHNHPSGDPTPSPEDTVVTKRLVEAGQMIDVEILDHVIIGHNRYISLKGQGLIP
ncbi:MAG: DNA repair protein RadC [Chloroflexota bacterium]